MTLNIFYHKIVSQERINSSQFYLPGGHLHCTALPVRANQKIPWQLWAVNMEPLIHNQLNALCLARRLPMPCHHCHPGLDTNIFGITSSNRLVVGYILTCQRGFLTRGRGSNVCTAHLRLRIYDNKF